MKPKLPIMTRELAPAGCREATRRRLLKGAGMLIGSLAAGSPLALLAPSRTWALELGNLSRHEGEVLMQMGRVLYPHERLPDAVYALLVKDLDQAAREHDLAAQLRAGVARLDRLAGGSFSDADAARRLSAVQTLEGEAFFSTVRARAITAIYDNEMAFAVFGYPGSAWEKGGYIRRGFQDLEWLPEPPMDASPPLPV